MASASRLTPTLAQIECALAVEHHGSFRAAALACHVSQPALSAQIAKLEQQLGVTLFDRKTRPVIATDIGRVLLPRFAGIVNSVREVEELAGAQGTQLRGPFRLGVIPTLAPYVLPRFLPGFCAEHTAVEITVREMTTEEIVAALRDDSLDAGVLATPLWETGINEQRLFDEPLRVYASSQSALLSGRVRKRLAPEHLPLDELLVMTEGHCLRTQVLDVCALRDAGRTPNFALETGSMSTLVRMIDRGRWFTVLPEMALDELTDDARQERVFEFKGQQPFREVGLVYRRPNFRANIRNAIAEAIVDAVPSHLRRKLSRSRRVPPVAD